MPRVSSPDSRRSRGGEPLVGFTGVGNRGYIRDHFSEENTCTQAHTLQRSQTIPQ